MSADPDFKIVQAIFRSLRTGIPRTLADLYTARDQSWDDFLEAVNYLIENGMIKRRGDGFVLQYALTSKGRETLASWFPASRD